MFSAVVSVVVVAAAVDKRFACFDAAVFVVDVVSIVGIAAAAIAAVVAVAAFGSRSASHTNCQIAV